MASEVVVGAAMYEQDRLDMPVTANVVSSEQIKEQPNPTLDDVLQDVPGVTMSRAGGTSSSSLQIRGSNTYNGGGIGTRVQALYDGFPINAPESGEIVWQSVNMNAADKVEVLKGAAATLYGSGAMGGVVNVTGHMPEKLEVRGGSSIGIYDTPPSSDESQYRKDNATPVFWNSYVGIGNKKGKWTYDVLYSHSDDNGYRENADNYMNDVKLKARYDIDASQYLQLSTFYTSTVGGYAYNWPYNTATAFGPAVQTPIDNMSYDIFTTYTGALTTASFASSQLDYIARSAAGTLFPIYNGTYDVYSDDIIKRKNALIGINYVNMFSDKLSLDTRLYYTFNTTKYEYNNTDANQIYPTGGGLYSTYYYSPAATTYVDGTNPAYPSLKAPATSTRPITTGTAWAPSSTGVSLTSTACSSVSTATSLTREPRRWLPSIRYRMSSTTYRSGTSQPSCRMNGKSPTS